MPQLRPTFSESWYRVADLRVRLRPSAQISRQFYRGTRWYVVRDPAGNEFHRLSAPAYRFVGLLDGSRTVAEAWDLVGGQLADDAPTQPEVIQILSQLHAANLLEANIPADAGVLLRRHKQMVRREWQGRLMNVLFPRIPLWDPDAFVQRWMPVARVVLSKLAAIIWLTVVIAAVVTLAPRWPDLKAAAANAIDFHANAQNYIWLFLTFVVIKFIHEMGHAFMCRRFGGEVHELGIMFLVFIPAPYVDASSAWGFPSKWARALVGLGGMIFELFVAALLGFVWAYTSPESMVNKLAYNAMLIASVSTIIFNANPLLRYDGYYILSDLLEIPNLRQKAVEYSLGLIKRHLFGVKSPQPLPPPGQRVWLLTYAITSSIYRVLVGVTIILVVSQQVPVLGVLMALGGVVTWAVVPVGKLLNYLLLDPELHRKRARAAAWVGAAAAVALLLVGVIRFTPHLRADGIVEPARQEILRADYSAFVTDIRAKDSDALSAGQVIMVMDNPELDARIGQLESKAGALRVHLGLSRIDDPAQANADQEELKAVESELADARDQQSRLTVRAGFDGVLIAPTLHELAGAYVHQGDQIGIVAQLDRFVIKTMVAQDDAALFSRTQSHDPEIRLAGDNNRILHGQVEPADLEILWSLQHPALGTGGGGDAEVNPTDPEKRQLRIPAFGLRIDLDNADLHYLPGQRAYVRFDLIKQPLIYEWSRKFWQLLQTQSANNKWL